ncbi:MAG: hypothetical protein SCH98_10310 [Deferrisomatales bacterium]|nr:hypothetical protein [Deferrisomatales bacterium]
MLHGFLGLSRDPFQEGCDDELYLEDPGRYGLRQRLEGSLREGKSVWLRGRLGSGRRTLLARAAATLAAEGRAVAWCGEPWLPAEEGGRRVLELLLQVTRAGARASGPTALEAVCEELLFGFCRGGPVIAALAGEGLAPGDQEELAFLSSLRLLGKPLVCIALWGERSSPLEGLEEVRVPPFSPSALRELLLHRATACAGRDLLAPDVLERISEEARSASHALELARTEVAHLVFRGGPQSEAACQTAPPPDGGVLDPSALAEVNRLLHALGSESSPR